MSKIPTSLAPNPAGETVPQPADSSFPLRELIATLTAAVIEAEKGNSYDSRN